MEKMKLDGSPAVNVRIYWSYYVLTLCIFKQNSDNGIGTKF